MGHNGAGRFQAGPSIQVSEPETLRNDRRTRIHVEFAAHPLDMSADRGLRDPQTLCR